MSDDYNAKRFHWVTRPMGRDKYSSMRIKKLKTLMTTEMVEEINRRFTEESDQALCMRWVLRGYSIYLAEYFVEQSKLLGEEIAQSHRGRRDRIAAMIEPLGPDDFEQFRLSLAGTGPHP